MNLTDMTEFVRLQLSEEIEAFYEDEDIEKYLKMAITRFVNRTHCGLVKKSWILDDTAVTEAEVAEVITLTCVEDIAGNIGGQYFKIHTPGGVTYIVWYDVDDGNTAPSGNNLVEVDISADATATAVATATATAINALTDITATVANEIVTVTFAVGYISGTHENIDVNNGIDVLVIAVTTTGEDENYEFIYKVLHTFGFTFLPSDTGNDTDGDNKTMTQVNWEDWKKTVSDKRTEYYLYCIDRQAKTIYFPQGFDGGTITGEFFVQATINTAETLLINDVIPEEYEETLCNYALGLAYKKDKDVTMSRDYMSGYYHDEREAKIEMSEKLMKSYNMDWIMDITNPHRDEDYLFQNMDWV